jgi:hypothetical protein
MSSNTNIVSEKKINTLKVPPKLMDTANWVQYHPTLKRTWETQIISYKNK